MTYIRNSAKKILDKIFRRYTVPLHERLLLIEAKLDELSGGAPAAAEISDLQIPGKDSTDQSVFPARILDERSRTSTERETEVLERMQHFSAELATLRDFLSHDERSNQLVFLAKVLDERSQAGAVRETEILHRLQHVSEELSTLRDLVTHIDTRTHSLMYQGSETAMLDEYLAGLFKQFYVENHARNVRPPAVSPARLNLHAVQMIAEDSADHLMPESTVEGVVRPTVFVNHIIEAMGREINVLDLGTGAAGFVFELQERGVAAYGIDGSDYCRVNDIGYWPLIGEHLHTCDITKPFYFETTASGMRQEFHLITAWEVLEHIPETGLEGLLSNICDNLAPGGFFIGSVSMIEYVAKNGTPYHVSLFPKSRWEEIFAANGLIMVESSPLDKKFFYRGNGPRFQDRHNYFSEPADGFHFIATRG